MNIILEFIGPILGIASAIVTIVAFFKDKIKHNHFLLASSLIIASVVILVWDNNKQKEYDLELLTERQKFEAKIQIEKQRYVSEDAKIVAGSINLFGSQSYGKYLAHLGSIVGFYQRHTKLYGSQYNQLSKQYDHWEEFFRNKRESGKTIYSSDYSALEGLVKSNLDLIGSIGNRGNNTRSMWTVTALRRLPMIETLHS